MLGGKSLYLLSYVTDPYTLNKTGYQYICPLKHTTELHYTNTVIYVHE